MRKSVLMLAGLAAASVPAAGQTVPEPVAARPPSVTSLDPVDTDQPVDSDTQTEDYAVEDDRHQRLTVQVMVQGQGPYDFLVDTAANRTVVSRQIVDRLGLVVDGSARLHSVTGATPVAMARLNRIEVDRRDFHGVEAAVLERRNLGADGILGTDSLNAQNVTFDFSRKLLSITPSSRRPPRAEEGTIVVSARRKNGRLIVTEAEANGHRINVVVDTGSEVSIGNEALRRIFRGEDELSSLGKIELASVTGALLPGEHLMVRELKLGDVTLRGLNILFAEAHTFGQLGLDRKPALLLGMNAIRAFDKVSIDFARKKLRFLIPKGSELDEGGRLAMR